MFEIDICMIRWYDQHYMKRTTLVLEDACMKGVRDLARQGNRTISEVVTELLSEGLQRRRARRQKPTFRLPSYPMGRTRVNLGDRSALEALMDS
jgi:hypothetical protein